MDINLYLGIGINIHLWILCTQSHMISCDSGLYNMRHTIYKEEEQEVDDIVVNF